jgi:hypothetical protein
MHVVQRTSTGRNRREGRLPPWHLAIQRTVWVALLAGSVAGSLAGAVLPAGKPEWSVEFGPGTIGPPVDRLKQPPGWH